MIIKFINQLMKIKMNLMEMLFHFSNLKAIINQYFII